MPGGWCGTSCRCAPRWKQSKQARPMTAPPRWFKLASPHRCGTTTQATPATRPTPAASPTAGAWPAPTCSRCGAPATPTTCTPWCTRSRSAAPTCCPTCATRPSAAPTSGWPASATTSSPTARPSWPTRTTTKSTKAAKAKRPPRPMPTPSDTPRYQVGVRELCEFVAKQGDLDLRFTPTPTAQEGIAGHALVAARRPAGYQSEVALSGQHGLLSVKGRADGYHPQLNRVEEVKTPKGLVDAIPDNHRHLHWAQAKVYGALLCRERGLEHIDVALVYFEVGSQKETVLCERHSAAELQAHFADVCERFAAWAEQELAHRRARDDSLTAMTFVHPQFRAGQRELAESVYKAAATGRCLLAQAPTGIGKTIGTVFPLLKACPTQGLDKVYFLTAKTSGRAAALHAIATLRAHHPTLRLRELELRAKDKACEHPDRACHGQSCPLAQGFYDRLPAARAQAAATGSLTHEAVRAIALAHQVCPYYLSQELVRWADVVVGDFNHYFDQTALLHGLMQQSQWRAGVLVDEA